MSVMRMCVAAGAVLVVLSLGASVAVAAPGDLDTSFGQGGVATVDLHHNASVAALAVQPDGRIVVAGTAISADGATTDLVTARFTAQGAIDTSFGNGSGVVQPDYGANETASGVALQSDGKIVVAGDSTPTTSGPADLLVARFNADGTQDTTFGGGRGRVTPSFSTDSQFGRALALTSDGNIVVGGLESDHTGGIADYGVIARLSGASGAPDSSFSQGEVVLASPDRTEAINAVLAPGDGSVVGVGVTPQPSTSGSDFYVVRVTATSTGFAVSSTSIDLGGSDGATAIAMLPNGKFLVAGYTDTNGTYDFAVIRLDSDLSLDTSFGTNGKTIIDMGGSDAAEAIALQGDGKIVLVGDSTSGSNFSVGVVRLLSSGQPDTSFGKNGVSLIGVGNDIVQAFAAGLQSDGDIIVGGMIKQGGSSQRNLLVMRLHGDATGSAQSTTGGGGGGSSGGGGQSGGSGSPQSGFSLSAIRGTELHVGSRLPALNPAKTPSGGLLVTFSLAASSKISIKIVHVQTGSRVRGACRPRPKGAKPGKHRCSLRTTVAKLGYSGVAGLNRFAFYGRLPNGRALSPGSYALTVRVTVAGAHVTADPLAFRIVHG